jgi:hypothetical protein
VRERTNEAPGLGPPAEDWNSPLCGYHLNDREPLCLAEATWHGIVDRGEPGAVTGLAACDEHKWAIGGLARWIHAFDTACGLPGAMFDVESNRCVVDLGDEVERAVAEASLAVLP